MQQVVRIFLKNEDNKFILVQHKGKEYYSLPGGHIEEGESIYKAIKREIKEELGLKIALMGASLGLKIENIKERVQPICSYKITYNELSGKEVKRMEYIFYGKIKSGELKKQDKEIETFAFFTLDDIINAIHTHKQVKQIASKLKTYE